jgi:hypothetical protein
VLELLTGSGDLAKALHDLGAKRPIRNKTTSTKIICLHLSLLLKLLVLKLMIIERLAELFEKSSKHATHSRTNDQWKIYKMWKINKRYHVMYIVEK